MRIFLANLIMFLAYPPVKLLQINAKVAAWLLKKAYNETSKLIQYLYEGSNWH